MADSASIHTITVASHNASSFGICTDYSMTEVNNVIMVFGQGKLQPSSIGRTAKNIVCSVSYIAGASLGLIAFAAKGTLTFTSTDTVGGTKTASVANAFCLGSGITHSDRTFAMLSAEFAVEDSASTTSLAFS